MEDIFCNLLQVLHYRKINWMNLLKKKQLLQKIKENPELFGEIFDVYYKTILVYFSTGCRL